MPTASWRNILVAIRDPAARKQVALTKASAIAEHTGAQLTLFHAFSSPTPLPTPVPRDSNTLLKKVAAFHRNRLLELAKPLRARGLRVTCEAVWDFPAAHAIVRRVQQTKSDLVVAESHRHSRIARWFLAYADWELIRECPCPVWFIKRERFVANPLVLIAVDPTPALERRGGLDDQLLQAAAAMNREIGGTCAITHIATTDARDDARTRSRPASVRTQIDALIERNALTPTRILVREGVAATGIEAAVGELSADLLVMGGVARDRARTPRIGTTAEQVLDNVPCDVLVVKPPGFKPSVATKGPVPR